MLHKYMKEKKKSSMDMKNSMSRGETSLIMNFVFLLLQGRDVEGCTQDLTTI